MTNFKFQLKTKNIYNFKTVTIFYKIHSDIDMFITIEINKNHDHTR